MATKHCYKKFTYLKLSKKARLFSSLNLFYTFDKNVNSRLYKIQLAINGNFLRIKS